MKLMPLVLVVAVTFMAGTSLGEAASGSSSLCSEFRALGWPDAKKLGRFSLTSSFLRGAREEAIDYFYNLDLDGDDIGDVISVGCSASVIPADPCVLESKLSSGGSIAFEAWRLYLIRHRGLIYAVTADESGSEKKIYRVGPKDTELACSAP